MRISDWSSDVCSSDLLFAHGGGEGLPVVGGDHEGGRPADDVAAIGLLQVVVDRPAAAVTAENGKAVDDDVGGDGLLARRLQGNAVPAIGGIAGDIDDAAEAVDGVALGIGRANV